MSQKKLAAVQDGFFLVYRDAFTHEIFAPEPYTEVQAWLWLIGTARFKPGAVDVNGNLIQLDRGQLAFGTRELAARWRWSRAKLRRFLDKLVAAGMIARDRNTPAREAAREPARVTILNYNKYQHIAAREAAREPAPCIKKERTIEIKVSKRTDNIPKIEAKAWKPNRVEAWEKFCRAPAGHLDVDVQLDKFMGFNGGKELTSTEWDGLWARWCDQAVIFARRESNYG